MQAVIETSKPFEASILWRLHDSYFSQRGHRAWQHGDIPWFWTNNQAFAAQHAAFLIALAQELRATGTLHPDEPVRVIEGGCGTGLFAANFVRSFEAAAPPGLTLKYYLTDASEKNVREAAETHYLAPFVAHGTVVPATFDLREPTAPRPLDGGTFDGRATMIINNYVCCVIPMFHFQRSADGGWSRLCVDVHGDVDADVLAGDDEVVAFLDRHATRHGLIKGLTIDWRWLPADPRDVLGSEEHVEILSRSLAGLDTATVGYPRGYLDFMKAVATGLLPGGVIMTNDYGTVDLRRLGGLREWRPQFYGNTFNQDVNLGILQVFARHHGWDCVMTPCDLALAPAALSPSSPRAPSDAAMAFVLFTFGLGGLGYAGIRAPRHLKARLAARRIPWESRWFSSV